jgi:Domain of unknown function (DUF5615)
VKLLIDECLSPELTKLAYQRDHGESSHVVWLGHAGRKDWELKPIILDGDWTFVTKNAIDFRGSADRPGAKGQYAGVALHAGLICLGAASAMDLDLQLELFAVALDELAGDPDLVNQVLEVTVDTADELHVLRYALPPD